MPWSLHPCPRLMYTMSWSLHPCSQAYVHHYTCVLVFTSLAPKLMYTMPWSLHPCPRLMYTMSWSLHPCSQAYVHHFTRVLVFTSLCACTFSLWIGVLSPTGLVLIEIY
ncbi:hypothetical protein GLOIN_2v1545608 [Rhizophagus irregularis DAOM 181602=DAOM 197198]|uniref:Uncharacterized protein n=1 Tax=Rhizophagus irregularis (strain DAOM 181602 / DAOM 197198 / MUCL 43194) TaxID=747089 RepID=A0A2P4QIW3_RHIID|nr:hypothetical protein GLOIN_2v1545608 [Rhizophagus irregularis DAOM 181602=DAOM 197198]POG77574.1 hypothetical protein GLOIN_2v1545608 [Rhizophagus irregularis DAOM 181602=DAOM 197198]|eukprot:XP_025184440.1 hypothetical protein GLOIN_2v1545608 [Rhizophagus irregularis DAOM 181602=DAOM 197198]